MNYYIGQLIKTQLTGESISKIVGIHDDYVFINPSCSDEYTEDFKCLKCYIITFEEDYLNKRISFKQFYKKYSLTFLEERLDIFDMIYKADRTIEIKTLFSLN